MNGRTIVVTKDNLSMAIYRGKASIDQLKVTSMTVNG
jgi:hypothetical protein